MFVAQRQASVTGTLFGNSLSPIAIQSISKTLGVTPVYRETWYSSCINEFAVIDTDADTQNSPVDSHIAVADISVCVTGDRRTAGFIL